MSPFDLLSGPHTLHLLGYSVTLGAGLIVSAIGWLMFATGAYFAVREVVSGQTISRLPRMVGAAAILAAMSAGLGLLLLNAYPTFARGFCFPYAVLALAAAVFAHAMQMGGRPISEE